MKNKSTLLLIISGILTICLLSTPFIIKNSINTGFAEWRLEAYKSGVPKYYFIMTNNEIGDLLGDLSYDTTITIKDLKKFRNKTSEFKYMSKADLSYHYSEDWLFVIPKIDTNVYLDKDYIVDINIKNPETLKIYYLNKGYVSYEIIKLEIFSKIQDYKDTLDIGELNMTIRPELYNLLGIEVIVKNNI
jgi:hypothetical protein